MAKDLQGIKEKDYKKYIVTSVVFAGSFQEALQEAHYGKIINIGLAQEESLDEL